MLRAPACGAILSPRTSPTKEHVMTTKPHSHQDDPQAADRKPVPESERTLAGRPADPNRTGAGQQVPPGMHPDDVWDPGNSTPDAPPVDNRSGTSRSK
ncbi:hypothetical protein C4E15_15500 [Achromobacter spanius]|uniref:Uncharacterized protein n=2 Tax=Alcaligenaceae TaxID=506 RepID=A0A2S5GRC0_9BURK|nr:hypothetical protein DVB37_19755 [Achromobacter sp. B7]PPA75496.1 hypothetical protein C4E15_15500 [Achromobacter spanius]